MFTKKIIVFCVILSLLGFSSTKGSTEPQVIKTPKEYISYYAKLYNTSEKELLNVAKCESSLKPNAIHYHDGGKDKHSFGVFQYQEATFNRFDDLVGEDLDYYSYHDQIKLTAYIYSKYPKLKTHWSCWNKLYK